MRDFNHTVNVLVKAYLGGKLAHRICTACAVGNIVADALGGKELKESNHTAFDNVCYKDGYSVQWPAISEIFISLGNTSRALEEIAKTGYTVKEIIEIERAFEECEKPKEVIAMDEIGTRSKSYYTNDEWMFDGLMSVVDVLAEIHGINLESKEEAKKLFVKV